MTCWVRHNTALAFHKICACVAVLQDGQAQWHHAVALLLWCANVSLKPSHLVGMVDDWALQLTELDMLYVCVRLHIISIVADFCTFDLQTALALSSHTSWVQFSVS